MHVRETCHLDRRGFIGNRSIAGWRDQKTCRLLGCLAGRFLTPLRGGRGICLLIVAGKHGNARKRIRPNDNRLARYPRVLRCRCKYL